MSVNTIKMNINGVEIANCILDHRECIKHFFALHYYIYNNMYMLDYPPESLFDNSILQEENECLLERTEDPDLELEAIDKTIEIIEKAYEEYKLGKISHEPAAFIAGYDIDNKYVWADYSKKPPKIIHEQLQELVDRKVKEEKIASVGQKKFDEKTKKESNTTGRCAEFHVVNDILIINSKFYPNSNNINNIRLIFAMRIMDEDKKFENRIKKESTGMNVLTHWLATLIKEGTKFLAYCDNCKFMFEGKPILKERFL